MERRREKQSANLVRSPARGRELVEALVHEHSEITVVATWHAKSASKAVKMNSAPEAGASLETPIAPAA